MSKDHDKATSHYNLGIQYERGGEMGNAVREYENAVRTDPRFPYPYKALGEIHYRNGRLDDALSMLRKSLDLDPDWIEALGVCSDILFDMGDTDKAVPMLERAIQGDPGNLHYNAQLGRMFIAQGRLSEAIELLQNAIRMDPADVKFNYYLAVAFGKRAIQDLDKSIEYWKKAETASPDDPKIQRNLGIALFSRGLMPDATRAFKRAVTLDPSDQVAANFIKFSESAE